MKKLLLTAAMTLCLAAPAFADIAPKTESVVTSDEITLADVFSGVADADDAAHFLAPAPALGKTVTYGTNDLTRISDAFNLGWAPQGDVHVTVRRASDEIDRFDIQAALEGKLRDALKGQKFDLDLSDRSIAFHVPGAADRTVNVDRLTYDAAKSEFKAVISAAAEPGVKKEVSGHIFPISQVPVLKNSLHSGDVISANDIDYLDMRTADITSSMITKASDLVGQTPRRGIAAMKPVAASDVQMPLIVKKGDLVTMTLTSGRLSLTAQGRAMDNGAQGDAIRVMNSSSKQVVDAVVTGSQTVSIKPPQSVF